jgi:hypothetical protein
MREFPRTVIAGNERDNNYPPLAWEDYAADVLISRFKYFLNSLHDLMIRFATNSPPIAATRFNGGSRRWECATMPTCPLAT